MTKIKSPFCHPKWTQKKMAFITELVGSTLVMSLTHPSIHPSIHSSIHPSTHPSIDWWGSRIAFEPTFLSLHPTAPIHILDEKLTESVFSPGSLSMTDIMWSFL
jgi:hypothetical protein